jgi:hypothetical protein
MSRSPVDDLVEALASKEVVGNSSHVVESDALNTAIRVLLRPLVRILLRNGVPFRGFVEQAKRVFVQVALQEFAVEKRKPSLSRASVITGLTRKEVSRLASLSDGDGDEVRKSYNRAAWVISGWVRDRRFHDARGRPASLPVEGEARSFAALVRAHSGDMPVRAVLDELIRVGAARLLRDGRVQLVSRAYVPHTGEREKLGILGADVGALISTIDHNLTHPPGESFLQLKLEYDNLTAEAVPRLRARASLKARQLLEELDRSWSKHDRDTSPAARGTGRKKAMLGIYYHEEDYDSNE